MPETPNYKSTTHLPTTDFPMKANLPLREPAMLARWAEMGLYEQLLAQAPGDPFVLHDGPPYANGHLHQGHLLNKILKDIIVKVALLEGRRSEFIPGWDCHGLPIELAVDKELGSKKRSMDRAAVRRACRAHAQKFIDIQSEEFQRLGIFAKWKEPYTTMSAGYEADIVRELARVVRSGAIYRGKKPVYWCPHDRTALAEAEIEYEQDRGPSLYVAFRTLSTPPALSQQLGNQPLQLAIWTTTPWTLPANLAIAAHPDFAYVAYQLRGTPTLVARERLLAFLSEVAPEDLDGTPAAPTLRYPERVLGSALGRDIEGLLYRHPFLERTSQLILGEHVTLEAGTGLVHTAPGHGQEDYEVGLRYGLPPLAPVDGAGILTEEAGPFSGVSIFEANPVIEQLLADRGALLHAPGKTIVHSYPHCWRCHRPVILRATDQWFISMEKTGLRSRALATLQTIEWIPAWGRERIEGMLAGRPDWCISRQRAWGVPIPAFYCEKCEQATLDPEILLRVAELFELESSDCWFTRPASAFLPEGFRCPNCGGEAFRQETDILDVWFDSGVSYAAVVKKRLRFPVDLYLEGSDQHRGWFHSSLLCALAAGETQSPYRACLTHGFVVDGQGRKLSKSLGNYLEPHKLLQQHGADILRLWTASEDYRADLRLSEEIMARLADGYRKIRNTLRFALGNLSDVPGPIPAPALLPIDRYFRARLHQFLARVRNAYRTYEFHQVSRATIDFCSIDLSALYFDVLKDRLYCSRGEAPERRAAQAVLLEIAGSLCRSLAPVLSFTAEEAYGFLPGHGPSVFLAGLPDVDPTAADPVLEEQMRQALALREDVLQQLEGLRRLGTIGSSQEARVEIHWEKGTPHWWDRVGSLADLFIVSEVELQPAHAEEASAGGRTGALIQVLPARGKRCDRCWNYRTQGRTEGARFLCSRCIAALA